MVRVQAGEVGRSHPEMLLFLKTAGSHRMYNNLGVRRVNSIKFLLNIFEVCKVEGNAAW